MAIHKLGDEISDKKLKTLISQPGKHSDGGGLYLQVAAAGQGSWVVRFGETWKSLGPADEISPDVARRWHAMMKDEKRADRDPFAVTYAVFQRGGPAAAGFASAVAGQALGQAVEGAGETFGQVLAEYTELKSKAWTPAVATNWRNNFAKVPALLACPVGNVPATTIAAACATFTDVVGDRMRRNIRAVLEYAVSRHIKQKRAVEHHEAMAAADVPAFMAELAGLDTLVSRALRFCIHTAARSGEVFKATWSEITTEDGQPVWIIPASHRQKGKAKLAPRDLSVPLTAQAIEALGPRGADDALIFGKLRRSVMQKLLRDLRPGELDVHGFRSTFRDWVGEKTDFPRDLAELALGHVIGSTTEQAYARGSQVEKRRPLMQAWSDFITTEKAQ